MSKCGQTYDEFKMACYEQMMPLQDEFMNLYEINSFEHWFYDQGLGAFHFKSDSGRNLYFKYVDVGSFSTKANTWNWGWANKTTLAYLSKPLEKVKAVGEANSFELLTTGLFEGDDYTGWELTVISAKLLNAIGMYRVQVEHLFLYFIFTNEFTQEEYDALEDKSIECENHGTRRTAFICQHLDKNTYTGFHEAFETDEFTDPEDDFQAWCNECEKARLAEGEWNETSMAVAKIVIVCDQCYFEIKKRNEQGE